MQIKLTHITSNKEMLGYHTIKYGWNPFKMVLKWTKWHLKWKIQRDFFLPDISSRTYVCLHTEFIVFFFQFQYILAFVSLLKNIKNKWILKAELDLQRNQPQSTQILARLNFYYYCFFFFIYKTYIKNEIFLCIKIYRIWN